MKIEDYVYVIKIVKIGEGIGEENQVGYLNVCEEFTKDFDDARISTDRDYMEYLLDEQEDKRRMWDFYLIKFKRTLEEVEE